MNLFEMKFQTIEVVGQDGTGFEDSTIYNNVCLNDIRNELPDKFLKEIHFVNPLRYDTNWAQGMEVAS